MNHSEGTTTRDCLFDRPSRESKGFFLIEIHESQLYQHSEGMGKEAWEEKKKNKKKRKHGR